MPEFNLNESKCNSCGTCSSLCPTGSIQMNQYPHQSPDSSCISCGHCEAGCEGGALQINNPNLEPPLTNISSKISPEELGAYMRNRRSIRNYKNKLVSPDTIKEVMDIVRYAPTGMNSQPVKWVILENPSKVKELSSICIDWMKKEVENDSPLSQYVPMESLITVWNTGIDPILRGAPHVFIATASDSSATVDGIIALSHLELALPAFGLGACWAGYLKMAATGYEKVNKFLNLKDDSFIGALMVGYPESKYFRIPKRNKVDIRFLD